jgi:hypothetical protein
VGANRARRACDHGPPDGPAIGVPCPRSAPRFPPEGLPPNVGDSVSRRSGLRLLARLWLRAWFRDRPEGHRQRIDVDVALATLTAHAKRQAVGSGESLSDLTGVFVHRDAHILAREVDMSRHTVSVASIDRRS